MYKIETSKEVDKFLDKHRDIAKKFVQNLETLKILPFSNNLDIKSLKWKKNHYRLRIWKYRFLYEIIENEILIYFYEADTRWDIYK